jgi:hypothetical protein
MVELTPRNKRILKRAYFDPSHAGGYSSPLKLHKALDKRISLNKIRKFLKEQESYTVLQQAKRQFKRLKVVSPFMNYLWDLDTANMTFYVKNELKSYHKKNRGFKHFLVAIDVFSKFLYTAPLRTLKADEMKVVLTQILANKKPDFIRTDRGSEFSNKQVKTLLRRSNIQHILTLNDTKANYAERVIRTIKDKIGRYLEHKETHEWVSILPEITSNYNHTYHRTIKKAPADVRKADEIAIWKSVYENIARPKRRLLRPPKQGPLYKFDIGDYVRLVSYKGPFDKNAFSHKWTTELHVIVDREIRQGIDSYKIVDYSRDEILGYFYERELQKVYLDEAPYFKIEKVLRERRKRGVTEYFVKFKNWPDKYNSWVEEVKHLEQDE